MKRHLALGSILVAVTASAGPAHAQIVNPYATQYYQGSPGVIYQRVPRQPDPYYGGQGYYQQPAPQPRRRAYQGQEYYPGMLVQPGPQQQRQQQPGFSLRRLFGYEEERRAAQQAPRPKPKPKAPPAPVVAKQEKPKVDPSTHVVVFGDTLADLTGQGLDDAFSDTPEIAVVRKARGDASLARDPGEMQKFVQDILGGSQKITLAVVMLGIAERQAIKEGETTHEPLSDRWKQLYRERVDGVVRALQERSIPVVWVGMPPMRNDKLSADYLALNEIYRESVERLGGSYVDIWPGFVNDESRYTATGPDVDGQTTKLRANDGVLFTRAGARKAAHFVDTEIKRILEAKRTGTAVAAAPAPVNLPQGPAVDQGAVPAPAEAPAPAPQAQKPAAGPVLPLTGRPETSPGGTLVSGRPRLEGEGGATVQKALREGVVPGPRPGRADDFRWPRS
jgi:hypothetical protein